jgi:hypothetical protein
MNVANELSEIAICLAKNRLIARLKKDDQFSCQLTVVVLAVASTHPMRELANLIALESRSRDACPSESSGRRKDKKGSFNS